MRRRSGSKRSAPPTTCWVTRPSARSTTRCADWARWRVASSVPPAAPAATTSTSAPTDWVICWARCSTAGGAVADHRRPLPLNAVPTWTRVSHSTSPTRSGASPPPSTSPAMPSAAPAMAAARSRAHSRGCAHSAAGVGSSTTTRASSPSRRPVAVVAAPAWSSTPRVPHAEVRVPSAARARCRRASRPALPTARRSG